MIKILSVGPKIWKKANKLGVKKKLEKSLRSLEENWQHPGLRVELLEPKKMRIWSFRVDRKVRALFIWRKDLEAIEILNLTVHYR